jgi:hypothetical protein
MAVLLLPADYTTPPRGIPGIPVHARAAMCETVQSCPMPARLLISSAAAGPAVVPRRNLEE